MASPDQNCEIVFSSTTTRSAPFPAGRITWILMLFVPGPPEVCEKGTVACPYWSVSISMAGLLFGPNPAAGPDRTS